MASGASYLSLRWVKRHCRVKVIVAPPRTPAEQAYDILAKQVAGMSAEEAAILLRPPPKRCKSHAKTEAKARITSLVRQAAADAKNLRAPLHGLHFILALPDAGSSVALRFTDECQGALCWALIGNRPKASGSSLPLASSALTAAEDEEESPRPTAKLEHTLFDEWIHSTEAQAIPFEITKVLKENQAVIPDNVPKGLPPKRPHCHHILLVPGKLPARSVIYRMTPDQLTFHKQEIAKLADNGGIRPTYSPICSPTIVLDKRDDGSGERKMRMVVNYLALNALTVTPDFPLPPIQTILEMLGGAKYFSSLDLETGLHQIRMAKEDRWKTAFRPVLGLFEYRVMPSGLKGAPATFQANINAYLQPLLGYGVIAYLNDVLIYSSDLAGHVSLLRQVLSVFLHNQFYPKFRKCKFARQAITYLSYTITAEGIKPAEDKMEAIRHWPEVLENETQVR
ncbi:hypothetical protein ENH_00042220 [Eimeria necatrix]|uniref:Reverse transcriptase domain-containing protein n=1 Tax=Eimeria necatrix TaxID=51315 RepID=U6MZ90_9EIME|nr:hypothetical protein ENH_00042220 [Eimeria necatrix]CDJ67824.1 hypothetical protein ENH_00042220 [Eimeria necatrix]